MINGYKLIHKLYDSFYPDKPFYMDKKGALMVIKNYNINKIPC